MVDFLNDLYKMHAQFISDTCEINKYSGYLVTAFPSIVFLVTNFILMYSFCHRYTKIGITSFRAWFFRELTFHWSYFYLSKLWFIFMRLYKYTSTFVCHKMSHHDKVIQYKNCHLLGLLILSFISTVPIIIFSIKQYSRTRIPNFLMWIGEDPWLRTEIGLSGHYLDRPPRFSLPATTNLAYRTKRSASIEDSAKKETIARRSKSVQCLKYWQTSNGAEN